MMSGYDGGNSYLKLKKKKKEKRSTKSNLIMIKYNTRLAFTILSLLRPEGLLFEKITENVKCYLNTLHVQWHSMDN